MGGSPWYRAYGLAIRSDVPLPELPAADHPAGSARVVIRHTELPPPPPFPTDGNRYRYVALRTNEAYFAWEEIGTCLVRDGREILIDPRPGVSDDVLRLPLLGILLGTLLHQRGVFTLHASAVAVDGGAVAFLGPKGAGKSTTAAACLAHGHGLVTDDVLALRVEEAGQVTAYPAFPQVKVWPAAADALGYDAGSLRRLSHSLEKRALRSIDTFCPRPVPLTHVYRLVDGDTIRVERIRGGASFATLLAESYAPRFLGSKASTPALFHQCRHVAAHVPMYRLQRPKDLRRLPHLVQLVERVCRTPPAAPGAGGRSA